MTGASKSPSKRQDSQGVRLLTNMSNDQRSHHRQNGSSLGPDERAAVPNHGQPFKLLGSKLN